jgi:hypothetical protein
MVTVKVKTVKNTIEVFNTESYIISEKKDLHPDLLDVKVYVGSRMVCHIKRHFQWFYKKFLYKPVQTELKQEGTVPTVK